MSDEVTDNRGVSEAGNVSQEFNDAFNLAASGGERPDVSAADNPDNVVNEVPVDTSATPVDTPVATEATGPVAATTTEPDTGKTTTVTDAIVTNPVVPATTTPAPDPNHQQPGESDEKFEQRYKTLQGIHRQARVEWENEKLFLQTQLEDLKKSVKEPSTDTKKEIASLGDSISEEDKEALKLYDEEFDVISKMEGKKRDIALKKLEAKFDTLVETIKTEIASRIAPVDSFIEETNTENEKLAEKSHFTAIREKHPDYEIYHNNGAIAAWIEAKPAYLKKAMLETTQKGTAEEVIELLSDFKKENNINTNPTPQPDNVVNIDSKKEERKQAMTAVTTRRGAVNASMSVASDFEGAFDEAIHKGG